MSKYLYNGDELPALPDYNDSIYKYLCIRKATDYIGGYSYTLYAFTGVEYFMYDNTMWLIEFSESNHLAWKYDKSEETWGKPFVDSSPDPELIPRYGVATKLLSWANFDVLNKDGSVFLKASDPVPVSTYTPNPAAMLAGFQLGAAIRRMRGQP